MITLVKPSYRIVHVPDNPYVRLERFGRTCYKSEDKITDDSAERFCRMILERGHLSVFEHLSISVRFVVDRGVTHELVRHRLAAYSQESTRYCDYGKKGMVFVIPPWVKIEPGEYEQSSTAWEDQDRAWYLQMAGSAFVYHALLMMGWTPQQARSVLPNSLKTEIVATMNLRQWRHVLGLRTSKAAHPQMREVMIPLLVELKGLYPTLFEGIEAEE